jgi:hypothetical protein
VAYLLSLLWVLATGIYLLKRPAAARPELAPV